MRKLKCELKNRQNTFFSFLPINNYSIIFYQKVGNMLYNFLHNMKIMSDSVGRNI